VDSELKDYLDDLRKDLKSTVDERFESMKSEVKAQLQEQKNISLESHEATRRQVSALGSMVSTLWREVKGSDPPPPPDGRQSVFPQEKAMRETVSEHDLTIASIQGEIIGVNSALKEIRDNTVTKDEHAELKRAIDDVRCVTITKDEHADLLKTVEEVRAINARQTTAMGIRMEPKEEQPGLAVRAFEFMQWLFKEREGQKFVLTTIAALTSLVTTIGTVYAAMTGHFPLSTTPAPAIQTVYVAPAPGLPSGPRPPAPAASK